MTPDPVQTGLSKSRSPRGAVLWIRSRADDVVDLFVYIVVLNLAVEYVPSVISEGFTLSLLTAGLLKIALELVLAAKNSLVARIRAASTRSGKAVAVVSMWVVSAGSKLVVLELMDVIFGDSVRLGGFISVSLLVIVLLASRAAVRGLLSEDAPAAP